jgi:oxygen-dependent protoporphyrinogen oxidase
LAAASYCAPHWQGRYAWPRSIPQFDARIIDAHAPVGYGHDVFGFEGVGGAVGVSVPDCIRQARVRAALLAAEH